MDVLDAPLAWTNTRRATRRRSSAQGMVEFAILAPLFFFILFGVVEMGRLVWTDHELTNGTREGARYAMVHGAKSSGLVTSAQVKTQILAETQGIASADLSVVVTYGGSGTGQPGETVTVATTYTYRPAISYILNKGNITLTSTSKVLIEH